MTKSLRTGRHRVAWALRGSDAAFRKQSHHRAQVTERPRLQWWQRESQVMVTVNQTFLAGGTEQGANSVQNLFITAQTAIYKLITSPNHSMAQEKLKLCPLKTVHECLQGHYSPSAKTGDTPDVCQLRKGGLTKAKCPHRESLGLGKERYAHTCSSKGEPGL